MQEQIRWSLEWACVGMITALLAPIMIPLSGEVLWIYPFAAAISAGVTGLAVGLLAERLYRRLPQRGRVLTSSRA